MALATGGRLGFYSQYTGEGEGGHRVLISCQVRFLFFRAIGRGKKGEGQKKRGLRGSRGRHGGLGEGNKGISSGNGRCLISRSQATDGLAVSKRGDSVPSPTINKNNKGEGRKDNTLGGTTQVFYS